MCREVDFKKGKVIFLNEEAVSNKNPPFLILEMVDFIYLLIGVEGATSWGLARAENPNISGFIPKYFSCSRAPRKASPVTEINT